MIIERKVTQGIFTIPVIIPDKELNAITTHMNRELDRHIRHVTRHGAQLVSHAWANCPRFPTSVLILTIITERPEE